MLYCAEKCESVGVRGCKRARDGAEPNDLLVCVPVVAILNILVFGVRRVPLLPQASSHSLLV